MKQLGSGLVLQHFRSFRDDLLKYLLQQLIEFFNAEPGSPNYGAERTPVQFFVIWHNHLAERIISSQYDVATFLSFEVETNLFEGLSTITTGDSWQDTHTATRRASKLSVGTVSLSSSSAAT
jgi:hypothetical protein